MSTSEKLRKALAVEGVTSGLQLADYLDSDGVIFFIRGRRGWESSYAELRYWNDAGDEFSKKFRPKGYLDVRDQCVTDAKEDAYKITGIKEWSRAPFSNCWLPSDDVSEVHEEFEPEEG